ncbi:DUF6082 family protein [Microbispora sp. NPDC088329]|uniref:DUF6082 family protein n=1 Tax=Microbispora sp. NPDC088329 TaxID=3154869 RepID=UPI00341ECA29
MRRQWVRALLGCIVLLLSVAVVAVSILLPVLLLVRLDDEELDRWSQIGQALTPIGIFFSGIAFVVIALTFVLQGRELRNQREELSIAREEQVRSSEIALRELHTALIRMAIDDPELRQVWPEMVPGVPGTKKDLYCNLILNLQKVAYETHTIELAELRGALEFLMASPDMYAF